jgi:F-type H+-transporting ATPase subunit delta
MRNWWTNTRGRSRRGSPARGPLNAEDRAQLEAQIAKLAGARVRASYGEDATLLGGAVVEVGSTVYDGSVRAQLERLKQRLVNA